MLSGKRQAPRRPVPRLPSQGQGNGTDYLYTGPADLKVEYNEADDVTVYTAKIREDLKFWDGEPVTAKDILFTYYTYLDPTYVGSTSLSSYDIDGLLNWRTQTSDEVYAKYEALAAKMLEDGRGEGYVANEDYTEEMYNDYWGWIDEQWNFTVECIYNYVMNTYLKADYASYAEAWVGKTIDEIGESDGLKVAFSCITITT